MEIGDLKFENSIFIIDDNYIDFIRINAIHQSRLIICHNN